jgi:hypothetical protein
MIRDWHLRRQHPYAGHMPALGAEDVLLAGGVEAGGPGEAVGGQAAADDGVGHGQAPLSKGPLTTR